MGISHQAPSMTLNINIKGRWWSVACLLQSAEAVTVHSSFSAALVHSRLFINACCCWQHLDAPIRKMWRNAEAPATVNKPLVRERRRETAAFDSAAKSLLLKCLFYRTRKWEKNTSLCLLLMDWVSEAGRSSRQHGLYITLCINTSRMCFFLTSLKMMQVCYKTCIKETWTHYTMMKHSSTAIRQSKDGLIHYDKNLHKARGLLNYLKEPRHFKC